LKPVGSGRIQRDSRSNSGPRVNEQVKYRNPQVRLIDGDGNQRGVMASAEALKIAQVAELDLVEVSPKATPPVCRVMDFSKYKFDQAKKAKEAKKKQKVIHVKEIKLHPNTDKHDYGFKKNHMEKFLSRGDKVKVTMVYRGREMRHYEKGLAVLKQLAKEVAHLAEVEKLPYKEGRRTIMILTPK
jgi:translation initiation factor IF-3